MGCDYFSTLHTNISQFPSPRGFFQFEVYSDFFFLSQLQNPGSLVSRRKDGTSPFPKTSKFLTSIVTSKPSLHQVAHTVPCISSSSSVSRQNSVCQPTRDQVSRSSPEADSALTRSSRSPRPLSPSVGCFDAVQDVPRLMASTLQCTQPVSMSQSLTSSCSCFNSRNPDAVFQIANDLGSKTECRR